MADNRLPLGFTAKDIQRLRNLDRDTYLARFKPFEKEMEARERNVRSINDMAAIARGGLASEVYNRLVEYIVQFEDKLDDDHEVGVRLVSFGQSITFHVTNVKYYNPCLISFLGEWDGSPVELIQNVSQLSFLLMGMKKPNPAMPKRRVGFAAPPEAPSSE